MLHAYQDLQLFRSFNPCFKHENQVTYHLLLFIFNTITEATQRKSPYPNSDYPSCGIKWHATLTFCAEFFPGKHNEN